MYRNLKVAIVVPAYNEEKLLTKTIETTPSLVDYIIIVNDASTDNTAEVANKLAKQHKRVTTLHNETNGGIGFSLMRGFKYCLDKTDSQAIGIVAGDAQCDPNYIKPMLDVFVDEGYDYVKANRFFHLHELKAMPKYRKIGNIFISLLTKFSTGYYSISDTQNGYGFFRRSILERVNFEFVKERYDYENTMLVALSIVGARLKDYPVPAIYGDETSTIKFLPTALRALRAVWVGFWRRIYYKYVLNSFHPVALFLFSGMLLFLIGLAMSGFVVYEKIAHDLTPSTGTIMLVILPLLVGLQLLLTAITMDMNNEGRG
jgi:glycosyltransferase involved in cell wall biosynthesis